MKKSLLLSGVAIGLLTASTTWAAETPDTIRAALTGLIGTQTAWGSLIDLNQITITPDEKDFLITVPAIKNEAFQFPEKTIRLIDAGEFKGQSQYRIEGVFDTLKEVLTSLSPDLTLSTEKSDSSLVWVPHYGIISQNSQNIQALKLNALPYAMAEIKQITSDSLIQPTENDRMNRADSQDLTDVKIHAQGLTLSIPSIAYQDSIENGLISPQPMTQILSSDKTVYQLSVPAAFLMPFGGTTPLASLSLQSTGSYQDNVFHIQTRADKIALDSSLNIGLPAELIPSEINIDLDIKGIGRDDFQKIVANLEGQDQAAQAEAFQKAVQEWGNNIVVQLNKFEVKNAEASIMVIGTLQNQSDRDLPLVNATVTITNLDKISPPPAINQAQCDDARKQLEALDEKAPDIDSQRMMANFIVEQACAPHGGFLDNLRPYLDTQARVTQPDGTTTDTLQIHLENNELIVNGKSILLKEDDDDTSESFADPNTLPTVDPEASETDEGALLDEVPSETETVEP